MVAAMYIRPQQISGERKSFNLFGGKIPFLKEPRSIMPRTFSGDITGMAIKALIFSLIFPDKSYVVCRIFTDSNLPEFGSSAAKTHPHENFIHIFKIFL